ncbi:MAG: DNA translocase FtsK [Candidatus Nanohaloarchaea archaeon]
MSYEREGILAKALGEVISETLNRSNIGVAVKSLPKADLQKLVNTIDEDCEMNIGLLFTGIDEDLPADTELERVRITETANDAIKWRNDEETSHEWEDSSLPDKIVVLSRGRPPRTNSLDRIEDIPSADIRNQIGELLREKSEFAGNKPVNRFIDAFQTNFGNNFSLEDWADFAASVMDEEGQDSIAKIEKRLYLIGLLPDDGLLNEPDKVRSRLEDNKRKVDRIANLSKSDQNRITRNINRDEEGLDNATQVFQKIRDFQRDGSKEILSDLDLDDVKELLDTASSSSGTNTTNYVSGEGTVVDTVFEDEGKLEREMEDIDERIDEAIENNEDLDVETSEGKRKIKPGGNFSDFIHNFVSEDDYGGKIDDVDDLQDAIRNFNSYQTEKFSLKGESFEKLERLAEGEEDFQILVDKFEDLHEKRARVVRALDSLMEIPLMRIMGDRQLYEDIKDYRDAYRDAQEILDNKYRELEEMSSKGAPKLLSDFLLLDTICVSTSSGLKIILTPLHPLHLWRYFELARRVDKEKDELSENEKEFLINAVEEQPHVLRSINTSGNRNVRDGHLIQSDEKKNLPIYAELDPSEVSSDRNFWEQNLRKFTQAYPPSSKGLKISVIDPTDIKVLIKTILKLKDKDVISGAEIDLVYVNEEREDLISDFSSDKQDEIMDTFGSSGSKEYKIRTLKRNSYEDYLRDIEDLSRHLVVVNDNSSPEIEEFDRDESNEVHPLYVPKQFKYDKMEDEISKTTSKEGDLFSEYQSLTNHLNNRRQNNHTGSVHELNIDQDTLDEIKESSIWTTVSSPDTNRTDFPGENLISVNTYGERTYAVYTSDRKYFEKLLARILNEYPIVPEKEDIDEIVENIINVENKGLLELINNESKQNTRSNNVKGSLGAIIAFKWLEQIIDQEKLIISIDDPVTRSWLNFSDSDRRADFLVVKFKGDNSLSFEIVEVKAVDDPEPTKFEIDEEEKEIEGDVVDQLSITTRTIRRLFEENTRLTSSPRMEVLKEQIFDELKQRDNLSNTKEWVDRLNNLFNSDEDEIPEVDIDPRLVSVEINSRDSTSTNIEASTSAGRPIQVDRLPQEVIKEALRGYVSEEALESPVQESKEQDEETEEDADSGDQEFEEVSEEDETESDERSMEFEHDTDIEKQLNQLKMALNNYNIDIQDIPEEEVEVGPNIIRYKVRLSPGVKQSKLEKRTEDIARSLALNHEPDIHRLSGTPYVAVDIAKSERDIVNFDQFKDELDGDNELGELPIIAGVEPSGSVVKRRIDEAPHMLIGGTTGSGKTVFMYNLLGSLYESVGPEGFELSIIDPKRTEFSPFQNDLVNLADGEVITDAEDAKELIEDIVEREIDERTDKLQESLSTDIKGHNSKVDENEKMKPHLVVIDEYADLLDQLRDDSSEFEQNIRMIAQRARNVGIHLVIATQKPSASIIDTDLRANLDARVAFRLPSASDSRVILNDSGAEKLGGDGDMIFRTSDDKVRLQGTYMSPEDLKEVLNRNSE